MAPGILLGATYASPLLRAAPPQSTPGQGPPAQAVQAATQSLLDKAHALEIRGRMDMAAQTWQQVLLADSNNTEALGGLARAARLAGNAPLASAYLDRLRAINPSDPGIARAENMGTEIDRGAQLQKAGRLAQQGQYAQAMAIYRKIYGDTPPPGELALAFYETEAATEEGRPHAIAGLRELAARNPGDARYQVTLGRILTYNPKTRAEGRKLLSTHSTDPEAMDALRQSLLWDAQNPATSADVREYLTHHNDAQLAAVLKATPAARAGKTAEQRAAAAATATRSAADNLGFKALNARHLDEAEARFKAILLNTPNDANALAGMGYVRMQQANFGGALTFLSEAKRDGTSDPGIDDALAASRFWYTMGEGARALNDNDLAAAEQQYRSALGLRPNSVEALEALGGTLLKAQQPAAAVPYFAQFVKLKPSAAHAWRGLFLAQAEAGDATAALATDQAMPSAARLELAKDPLYLRALASAYTAVGRDADAQRVLRAALDLPFPADARGLEAGTELQYAELLQAANRPEQAAGLFRQVLARDGSNTDAWQGLVRAEHQLNHDAQALQTLESMPPASYARAMREPGFEATVASLYQGQGRLDVAQEILEKAIAQQVSSAQKPSVPEQLQLAGLYVQRNKPQQAYPIYRRIATDFPDRTEAWKGMLTALHQAGRDSEALAQVRQIPPATRAQLENDVEFLQTIGSVYNQLGQPKQSQIFLERVQQRYAEQHAQPPADVDIQDAWLLYNGMNDAGLYRQLMALGSRTDLTEAQRRTVQTIWANWAVRRANQAAAAGNQQKALAILNATAHSFPDNPGVMKALASGYARAGLAKQAVLIWKAQDLTAAPASDYKSAVGAALAAGDSRAAETWLRFALEQYPKDPEVLILGAKFEQARGDTSRAADYYRASLNAMPPSDAGAELTSQLSLPIPQAAPQAASQLPSGRSGQDLAALLAPRPMDDAAPTATQPYLPGGPWDQSAPVQIAPAIASPGAPVVPPYMSNPTPPAQTPAATPRTRLRDYVPQASLDEPLPADATALPVSVAIENFDGSLPLITPAVYQQQQVARLTRQVEARQEQKYHQESAQPSGQMSTGQSQPPNRPGPLTEQPASAPVSQAQTQNQTAAATPPHAFVDPLTGEVYGPYVPYKPPPQLHATPPPSALPSPEPADILPTARYMPNARVRSIPAPHPDIAAADAARIREHQSDLPGKDRTGESKPPLEQYDVAPTEQTQYLPSASTSGQAGVQVPQPAPGARGGSSATEAPQQSGKYSQQYPQPNTSPRSRTRTAHPAAPPPQPGTASEAAAAEEPSAPRPVTPGLSYPGIGQPLTYQPYPQMGSAYPAYPVGQVPSDADLEARQLPPLRGSYFAGRMFASALPLTPRQQAERELATLEASYSGWLGGTASARYRSGTVGLDRLTDVESTAEASATLGNGVRLSVIPRSVFLNSGTLNVAQYSGVTTGVPVLGTFALNSATAPAQQSSSGVGGEFQLSTRNFAAAAGYTPYQFLVRSITGRLLFKPSRHVTFYASRDSVAETQLSYAGMRDPGSASAAYAGNIWGGVVATGGGVRFDGGDDHAGFYLTLEGADVTGSHVLGNNKFEGSMGAWFLAHSFPGYGRINLGASLVGMHYAYNERGLSYGLGGYFSPNAYLLASLPVTFIGRYGNSFHYTVAGSVGVQSFQESNQLFFPLDTALQNSFASTANGGLPCTAAQTAAHTCAQYPTNSNTGANYGLNFEGAYSINEHWFAGGFLSANNANNYNTVTAGFFVRYLFRPQIISEDYPTGLFPVEGFRPLRVP